MNAALSLIHTIDALLPQTQCGLCGHRDGCLPYAKAIAEGEAANKCVPGGQPVADALATLLHRPLLIAEPSQWPTQIDGRPQRMKAIIREDECIGCTKCISACPVDAIVGSAKLMHTIFNDLCTGCELCIAPCPVDCIDLVEDSQLPPAPQQREIEQSDLRQRYYAHIQREEKKSLNRKGPIVRAKIDTALFATFAQSQKNFSFETEQVKQQDTQNTANHNAQLTIELAKLRTQIKKIEKQLSVRFSEDKKQQLDELKQKLSVLMDN